MSSLIFGSERHRNLINLLSDGNTYDDLLELGYNGGLIANVKGERWIKCQLEGCEKVFATPKKSAKYCCRDCSAEARSIEYRNIREQNEMLKKGNPVKSKKLRESARGQDCTLQVAGVCNGNPETSVLAHMPSEIAGHKSTDISSCVACSSCHDWLDRRNRGNEEEREWYMRRAQVRTLHLWLSMGLLKVA